MGYSVRCECGKTLPVVTGQAGTLIRCGCSRSVEVPPLRELRISAGQAPSPSPELSIPAMLQSGTIPGGPDCACCGGGSAQIIELSADCERLERAGTGWMNHFANLLVFGWLGGLARIYADDDAGPVHGRNVHLTLMLRMCTECCGKSSNRSLREVVLRIPEYAPLIDKYPNLELSVQSRIRYFPEQE